MLPYLSQVRAEEHLRELREAARRTRGAPPRTGTASEIAIRVVDGPSLAALAALDGVTAPAGTALVAEVDGAPGAALPLDGGRAFADPFRPTAELIALLELRAGQLAGTRRHRRVPRRRRLVASRSRLGSA